MSTVRTITLALALLLLAGCQMNSLPPYSADFELQVLGVDIDVVLAEPERGDDGEALYYPGRCVVVIHPLLKDDYPHRYDKVVAHEVAHCLDTYLLSSEHNDFEDEGCAFGEYYCLPAEGYAETYARVFERDCESLSVFGWPGETEPAECESPPSPESVTPDMVDTLINRTIPPQP